MINQVIRLTNPKRFESFYIQQNFDGNFLIVRPTYMSICQADQRYYNGLRDKKTLKQKLPMSLIHESIGEIVHDPKKEFKVGDRVVLIPALPGYLFGKPKSKSVLNEKVGENYCRDGKFRSSGYDGFMQELVFQPREMVVKLPDNFSNEIAAFTELFTIGTHAIRRFKYFSNNYKERIGVWGDGSLGFLTALLLKFTLPNSKIIVYGKHEEKLKLFTFAHEIYQIDDIKSSSEGIDHAFECVGGRGSQDAINQIIEIINPGGTISLLGVAEERANINTRMVLEKGILLQGNSRSGKVDFVETIELFKRHSLENYLSLLVSNVATVRNIADIVKAFEYDKSKIYGKTVIKWEF